MIIAPFKNTHASSDGFDKCGEAHDVPTRLVDELDLSNSPPQFPKSVTRSRSSSTSQGSSTSRHFAHYHEPTVLDKPDAVDHIVGALENHDIDKLAELVQEYGLPPSLRPAAWPALLSEHPLVKKARASYAELPKVDIDALPLKRIKGDIQRLRRRGIISPADEHDIHEVLVTFLHTYGSVIQYESPMLWVAGFLLNGDFRRSESVLSSPIASPEITSQNFPAAAAPPLASAALGSPARPLPTRLRRSSFSSHSNESDVALAFTGIPPLEFEKTFIDIMLLMRELPEQYSEFVTALRIYLPNVGDHFAREGIFSGSGGDDWLSWWLKWLGIRAFPSDVLARLWDSYFSSRLDATALMKLHRFNCIVLMRGSRAGLAELDQCECRQFLMRLPPCKDVEAVVSEGRQLAKAS